MHFVDRQNAKYLLLYYQKETKERDKKMRINFDMDGTIANLYAVDGWLPMLRAEDTTPYKMAKPMVNFSALARLLNKLQRKGYEIAVISWGSKVASAEYDKAVAETKKAWLAKHLPSVKWDAVTVVPYGTPKDLFCFSADDVLFDDEAQNRNGWSGKAYDVSNILETLKAL